MKRLSKTLFNQISNYMCTEVRPLERSIFNYYFNDSSADDVMDTLQAFQNPDGGFGQGIEPDFKLQLSSPMATSIGLRHLSMLDKSERAETMIEKAVNYLESTFDLNRNGWYSVSNSVNNYPHAPWWEFKDDINMTVIDYSWGNPTVELIGYLYKYKAYVKKLDVNSLISYAINYLNTKTEFKSEHEIFCYIHMYNAISEEFSSKVADTLKLAVSQLVNVNQSDWSNYVPSPLRFINMDSKNFFGIDNKSIDENLDYLIDKLELNGSIQPTWQWDKYLEEWEIAKIEWMGILTLEALLSLLKFNRL